jgi:putative PIN family toxin of toxin-antitoxin system
VKVFFDTNVLVSAFTARGLCADLFKGTIASCTLVVSEPLLAETRRILLDKFKAPQDYVDEAIGVIEQDAVRAAAHPLRDIRINDRDDVRILSSALHGKANFFVTGDREVLALGKVDAMRILSPRQFWEVIRDLNIAS